VGNGLIQGGGLIPEGGLIRQIIRVFRSRTPETRGHLKCPAKHARLRRAAMSTHQVSARHAMVERKCVGKLAKDGNDLERMLNEVEVWRGKTFKAAFGK
jgi:hypothetical protein